ncbi:MAG: alpha/beta hydrolase [Ruminococcaceae bacterium]|nr:alpha/beta hydrolase [Oscillospiraceae bacterium]
MKKRIKIALATVTVLLIAAAAAVGIYASDYYKANETAVNMLQNNDTIEIQYIDDIVAFCPQNAHAGIIFYPGGKVEYTAYAPLLNALAENGFLTVAVKMPLNLAVLDVNAADGIKQNFPEIEQWYMSGHSLGGSMAASYVADHTDEYEGLILLASYSTADLSDTDIKVISIYGTEDMVLNMENYKENYSNLPGNTEEFIIEDGCHAYFGSYGKQAGDGEAKITPQQQWEFTAETISEWIYTK